MCLLYLYFESTRQIMTYFAKYSAGLKPIFGMNQEEHEEIFTYADVDADKQITIQDATLILTYYARNSAGLNPDWENIINSR